MSLNTAIRFDSEKAIEAILYIASTAPIPDIYHICKVLYFADRCHLEEFGRLICGDRYVAMRNGPVPSGVYDLLKDVRDQRTYSSLFQHAAGSFNVTEDHEVVPLRDVHEDIFSDSDIECLDRTIQQHGQKGFRELCQLSHDAAYESADRDDYISFEAILRSLPSSQSLAEHLSNPHPERM